MLPQYDGDELLTIAECADILAIYGVKSRTFVRDEIKDGRLPALIRHRASGRTSYAVKRADLLRYIAQSWAYTGARASR